MGRGRCTRSAMVALALALSLAGGACDSEEPQPVAFRSGARLRAHILEIGEERLFIEFFDSELGAFCSFRATSAGIRCVPNHRAVQEWGDFSDSECTQKIASGEGRVGDFIAREAVVGACTEAFGPEIVALYRLTEERSPDATVYWPTDGCTALSGFPSHEVREVPLDGLVSAELELVSGSAALSVRTLVASDGARLAVGLHDVARGGPCLPTRLTSEGGAFRCIPSDGLLITSAPVGEGCFSSSELGLPECFAPSFIMDRPGCGEPRVFAAGPCSVEGGTTGIEVREELDLASLPLIDSVPVGGERLSFTLASSDRVPLGVYLSTGAVDESGFVLFDRDLQQGCRPLPDSAGVTRCFSGPDKLFPDHFADPGCTKPSISVPSCGKAVPPFGVRSAPGGESIEEAFVIEPSPLPVVFSGSPTSCSSNTNVTNGFAITEGVELSVFPELISSIE